jgi:hypothetical protein
MGHLRLWKLPRTQKWIDVVALLRDREASVEQIAAGSIEASTTGLKRAAQDPALAQAFWLLTQIPLSARRGPFPDALRRLGLPVGDEPSALEIAAALSQAIDATRGGKKWQSDVGEMAKLAATESVKALAAVTTGDLFIRGARETQAAFRPLSTQRNFGILARDFFSRFVNRYLAYYLSRELSNHVGVGRRFPSSREHTEFNEALDLHCRQAARIVQNFAGEWFSKADFDGGITREKASGFIHVALGKLRDELLAGASRS